MPSCWEEALSALFIGITGKFRLTHEDRVTEAEDQLEKLLQQLERRGAVLEDACATARSSAVAMRGDRVRCRAKIMEYRRARSQFDRLVSYKETVLQHMDALRNTELNKSLITTLQESSKTLKTLGVMDGVRQAELVVQDVETSMQQVHELTSLLGTPLDASGAGLPGGEFDLERELELMLAEDEPRERPSLADARADTTISEPPQARRAMHSDEALSRRQDRSELVAASPDARA